MSEFIPNSHQTPDIYVDRLMHLLTAEEWKVLTYMVRRIFGFGKRQDRISLSQLTRGTKSKKDGRMLDHGTGLGDDGVRKALSGLVEFGLVQIIEPACPAQQLSPLYELQPSLGAVDMDGLEARWREHKVASRRKTAKARIVSRSVAQTSPLPCATDQPPSVRQTHNIQGEIQPFSLEEEKVPSNSSSIKENPSDFMQEAEAFFEQFDQEFGGD